MYLKFLKKYYFLKIKINYLKLSIDSIRTIANIRRIIYLFNSISIYVDKWICYYNQFSVEIYPGKFEYFSGILICWTILLFFISDWDG